jgi:hypothetical protein
MGFVTNDDPVLIRLDPESDACYEQMREIIAEELQVRIALQDRDVDDPEWLVRVSGLAADALLGRFQVRSRTADNPRYRWESPHRS